MFSLCHVFLPDQTGGCGGLRGDEVREAEVESSHWGNVLRWCECYVSVTEHSSSFSLHLNEYETVSMPPGSHSKSCLQSLFTPSEKTFSACSCLLANTEDLEKAVLQTQLAFSCSLFYRSHFPAGQSCNNNATALRISQEMFKKVLSLYSFPRTKLFH